MTDYKGGTRRIQQPDDVMPYTAVATIVAIPSPQSAAPAACTFRRGRAAGTIRGAGR
jgi:hypothetical protein